MLIRVAKRFMLQTADGMTQYLPGVYDVDPATADHWYVKAHLEGFKEPPRPQGPSFAQASLKAMQAVRMAQPVGAMQEQAQAAPPPGVPTAAPVAAGTADAAPAARTRVRARARRAK